jgi:hypothetical protein
VPSCGLHAPAGLSSADPLGHAYSQSAASAGWSVGSLVQCSAGCMQQQQQQQQQQRGAPWPTWVRGQAT